MIYLSALSAAYLSHCVIKLKEQTKMVEKVHRISTYNKKEAELSK